MHTNSVGYSAEHDLILLSSPEPPEHAGKAPPLALFRATRLGMDHAGILAIKK
jgi:hypothetical protein